MARRLLAPCFAALAGWLAFRLIRAQPLPDHWALSLDALARWLGPLRPLELGAEELGLARQVLAGLALAGAAAIVWLSARGFRLSSRSALLGDRLRETGAALESVSASFRDLVERTHDLHYRHDLAGRMEWMSEGGLRLLGYTAKDLASLSIADLLDADHLAALRSAVQRAVDSERSGAAPRGAGAHPRRAPALARGARAAGPAGRRGGRHRRRRDRRDGAQGGRDRGGDPGRDRARARRDEQPRGFAPRRARGALPRAPLGPRRGLVRRRPVPADPQRGLVERRGRSRSGRRRARAPSAAAWACRAASGQPGRDDRRRTTSAPIPIPGACASRRRRRTGARSASRSGSPSA